MPRKKTQAKKSTESAPKVQFDYIKSNYFRVAYANGVVGGLTPTGEIHIGFWNQRRPFPKSMSFALNEDSSLGEEVDRDTRQAIVREIEVGVVLNVNAAIELVGWLSGQLDSLQELILRAEKQRQDAKGELDAGTK